MFSLVETLGKTLMDQVISGNLTKKTVVRKNIVFEVLKVDDDLEFPDRASGDFDSPDWVKQSVSGVMLQSSSFAGNLCVQFMFVSFLFVFSNFCFHIWDQGADQLKVETIFTT